MAENFSLTLLTPARELVKAEVSEVVVPSYDGERGVLAGHENFVGQLGTGVLKMVQDGDDYWFMVSSGIFEVNDGKLTVLAEVGEDGKSIDETRAKEVLVKLEAQIASTSKTSSSENEKTLLQYQREKARLEAHRRTALLN